MRAAIALALPWLCLLALVSTVLWDQSRRQAPLVFDDGMQAASLGDAEVGPVALDPVCGMRIRRSTAHPVMVAGLSAFFCSESCRNAFLADPMRDFGSAREQGAQLMRGLPTWMVQTAVALLLLLSFGLFELLGRTRRESETVPGKEIRLDVTFGWLRRLLKRQSTLSVLRGITVVCFVLVIAAGLFGNQNPAMNIAPVLTWTVWWVGLVFVILYAGKVWCAVCPWDAIAHWVERLSFSGPRKGGIGLQWSWPKPLRNIWIAVGFFVLLTWIEIGMGITGIPRATAWVALGMLGLTLIGALFFERKSFCRYGCFVGRISGLYAMFSSLELRGRDPQVCQDCRTVDCMKGNDLGDGCPTFEPPKVLERSTYCLLCTECIKTCPHDNPSLRLRPWGSELAQGGKRRMDEAMLAMILLSLTAFHGLTMTPTWTNWIDRFQAASGWTRGQSFSALMAVLVVAPLLLYLGLVRLAAVADRSHGVKTLFVAYAYAMLPIALFYHLAHNAEHFFFEAPRLIPLISDPFGWGWDLFGTSGSTAMPLLTLETLWGMQVVMVLIGHLYSLWITHCTSRELFADRRDQIVAQLPLLAATILFSIGSLWLLQQPMEMRLSGM